MTNLYKKLLSYPIVILPVILIQTNSALSNNLVPFLGNESAYIFLPLTQQEYENLSGDEKFTFYDGTNELFYSWQIKNGAISSPRILSGNGGVDISANFLNLKNASGGFPYGGAISLNNGSIGDITGDFISNSIIIQTNYVAGGAIYSQNGNIGDIHGDFVGNNLQTNGVVYGGAIDNYLSSMGTVSGNFIGNHITSTDKNAYGGAFAQEDSTITKLNANFIGNYAIAQKTGTFAYGGAIWTNSDLTIHTDGTDNIFSGNYTLSGSGATKVYNAIYVDKAKTITFDTRNKGTISLFDNIDGSLPYNINITGDNTGHIYMKNDIINANNITISNTKLHFDKGLYGQGSFKTSSPNLSLNDATFDLSNGYIDNLNIKNYSSNGGILHIDVNPDLMTADVLNFNGNVTGTTKLVIYATSEKNIQNLGGILFATSTNDTTGNENSFEVFRVYTSPYLYNINYINNQPNNKQWELVMNNDSNPDFGNIPDPDPDPFPGGIDISARRIKVVSEVIAYNGLPTAAYEQTRSLKNSIIKGLGQTDNYKNYAWVNPIYNSAKIEKTFNVDANIQGVDAGFSLQQDLYNHLGIFASYRQGSYDLNGQGKKIYASIGSQIDIDSYITGLYHSYKKNGFRTFAAIGGGIQKADIKTQDGISERTKGSEMDFYFEAGKTFEINPILNIEPILSASHTILNFNNIHDTYGKTAHYEIMSLTELELALKVSENYSMDNGKYEVYIKPGVVKALSSGDNVAITGMDKSEAYEDNILGRVEVGGNLEFDNNFSLYSFANYTAGSHYESLGLSFGLGYSW